MTATVTHNQSKWSAEWSDVIFNGGRSGFLKCRSVVVFTRSKGAFTPDANAAKKSCYSRLVGRFNI